MSSNDNLNQLLDNIIYEHKKQLNDLKKTKYNIESVKEPNSSLIKEIENYNPDIKSTNEFLNDPKEGLNLNFNYKTNKESINNNSESQHISRKSVDSSFNKSLAGKIRYKPEIKSNLKYNFSDKINANNHYLEDEKNSDVLKKFESLKTSKDYLLINNNKLNEEIQFLKSKLSKKKAKLRDLREKSFLLDQRLHKEEKKNIELEENINKLNKAFDEKIDDIDIYKDKLISFEKIVDYFVYFLNKIQSLYPSNFKKKDQRNFLQQNEKSLDLFRERLIELENYIVKGLISSNKNVANENVEERVKVLNERIFDLEEENRSLKDKMKFIEENKNVIGESKENREMEIKRIREFELRLAEIENQLTSKI